MNERVYIVEDHPDVRETYIMFLRAIGGLDVLGAAATGQQALDEVPALAPDLVIIDVSLPGMSGLDIVKALRERSPSVRLLVVSGHDEVHFTEPARQSGADGFVRKGDADTMLKAVRTVLDGDQYFPTRADSIHRAVY